MTAWTTISNALVAVGAKPFATTIQAFRDNVIAAFEGDATAVAAGITLQFAALDGGFKTAGGIGSYVFASRASGSVFGANVLGSSLTPTSAIQDLTVTGATATHTYAEGAALSGTWKCMGTYTAAAAPAAGSSTGVTLWLRIA